MTLGKLTDLFDTGLFIRRKKKERQRDFKKYLLLRFSFLVMTHYLQPTYPVRKLEKLTKIYFF